MSWKFAKATQAGSDKAGFIYLDDNGHVYGWPDDVPLPEGAVMAAADEIFANSVRWV